MPRPQSRSLSQKQKQIDEFVKRTRQHESSQSTDTLMSHQRDNTSKTRPEETICAAKTRRAVELERIAKKRANEPTLETEMHFIEQKRMVLAFRLSELQMLLTYAGKCKKGKKNELQNRALEIIRLRNPSIFHKILELYKSMHLDMSLGERSQTVSSAANFVANQRASLAAAASGNTQTSNFNQVNNATGYSGRSSSRDFNLTNVGYSGIQSSHRNSYPLSPDVRLKKLPFYDVLGELLKPSTLAPQGLGRYQDAAFSFCLTPQQANTIDHSRDLRPGRQDYTVQVQMRFCLLETTSKQEDNFPPNITVKINDKMCPLPSPIPTNKPGVEPKRPSRSVNVTALCKISPTVTNRINVGWSSEYGRCYVISVYLVQKLTSEDLLQRLKGKGPRLADFTKSLIKQKLREDGECEIATTSLRCSLLCPLGKMRMALPCRAETCNHLQCFDASLFLLMNERKPTWTCPVCDKPALYDNLVIDGYFQDVLQANSECTEVTLHEDGNWTPLAVKKEPKEAPVKSKSEVAVETLSDDSDDDGNDDLVIEEVYKKRKNDISIEIITLDSEDDSCELPSKRRPSASSSQAELFFPSNNGFSFATDDVSDSQDVNLTEGIKSSDSWCVGEVEPGKRLIFRKSTNSEKSNNVLVGMESGGVPIEATSPESGSSSPQIICLDSPSVSPHQDIDHSSVSQTSAASALSSDALNTNSTASSLAALGSDLIPVEVCAPVLLESPRHSSQYSEAHLTQSTMNSYNLSQDALDSNNYSKNPLSISSASTGSYSANSGSQTLFNPMMAPSVSPSANTVINFRPPDDFL